MKNLELKLPPVVLVVFAAIGMWLVSRSVLNSHVDFPGMVWWSIGVAAVGFCIGIAGVLEFTRVGTTADPRVPDQSSHLVVSGVYRYSRNPMYLGLLLVLCGWCLFLGSSISVLLLPAFILYMNRFQIVPEERFMQEKFAGSYRQYKSQVRRWI
ncbi:methyltransferase family protein [Marinomonas sp. IMCC 4694]|uniref:methyltransferase family protein n=1 Tax=Marinomonas sp. IMCC 4694 TaxID=2605432 RepID=UPI0011E74454|nr:isoprenylcysteine carboxylmethyltransferase family protein [Marinomonas sp. IMCC 4694]TYL48994.1 isoprenylcysteine carboxylmethyltransferase family protein [Marinomonas sp. IMCC 4694]